MRSAAALRPGNNSGSRRPLILGSRNSLAADGSQMPRQMSNWATTDDTPASRPSRAIPSASCGRIRQRLGIVVLTNKNRVSSFWWLVVWCLGYKTPETRLPDTNSLLLLHVHRVLAQPRGILAELQFLAAGLAAD